MPCARAADNQGGCQLNWSWPLSCFELQMHAQWYLSGGHRQMHSTFVPLACKVILARGQRASFKDSTQLSGTAQHRLRDSVTLTHPCQHDAAHLPCTLPSDSLHACRPARPGARDRACARAFVMTRAGTNTMARCGEEEDEIVAGTSFGAAGGTKAS
jgi:hypothetical protein